MALKHDIEEYYKKRAHQYEEIYLKEERREDISSLKKLLKEFFSGHDVLEVASGTGFWTEAIALTARTVLAVDLSEEMHKIASQKKYPKENVRFQTEDAYCLDAVTGDFTAGFSGFWWSHVPRPKIPLFLDGLHKKIGKKGLVVFIDNNYIEGVSHPIVFEDDEGNTYQRRSLGGDNEYQIVKNYPTEGEFHGYLSGIADEMVFRSLTYFWCLSYRIGI
jgi:SAM-dependent methyltransferase